MTDILKSPFPFFGGKSRIAAMVWDQFGHVDNYVEPFFGSGAVLLGCPWPGHTETVNDADGLLCNFFRALQYAPDEVAACADHPVNELDLHAWHRALVASRAGITERLIDDPRFYDAELAGQWVWGISQWIGTGWCPPDREPSPSVPYLKAPGRGNGTGQMGVHREGLARGRTKDGGLWQTRPNLGNGVNSEGNGVHQTSLGRKMPFIASPAAARKQYGLGIHGKRLSQQMPNVGSTSSGGEIKGQGIHRESLQEQSALYDYFRALAARLRRVRVLCGDFERILGPSVTWRHGMTAVFLDPPYADAEHAVTYSGGGNVWERVTAWCEANGDHPLLRIALCGYESTWQPPAGWRAVKWRTPGGYGSQGNGRGRENAAREVAWFSPACEAQQMRLL